jgi:hypothetical protein
VKAPHNAIVLSLVIALSSASVARSERPPADPGAPGGWKVGIAKTNITPDEPMWLAGYGGRDRPAEGKLHDVWIKVLALEDAADRRAVLLTSDLCGIPRWMVDSVSDAIYKQHGLDRSQVQLTYSHNHCAPVVRGDLEHYYPLDAEQQRRVNQYSERLEKQMIHTIGEALASMRPVTVSAGTGTCTFAVNRRNNREADVPEILARGEALKGPVDHTVPVLAVHDSEQKLLAVVFAYACHNTTLSFYQWCGDFAGFAQIAIERDHPGATALFVAGCGGDQNPLPRRTVELCEKYGNQLATAVNDVLRRPLRSLEPRLRTALESVTLDYDRVATREELEQHAKGTNPIRVRWAKRFLKQLDAGQPLAMAAPYTVAAWRLGDQDWITLGGEALVDYAHRFRREFGDSTWVTSYSADLIAYIPSRRNIIEGLYEGTNLYEYMHPADRWALDTEDRIAAAVARLMKRVRVADSAGRDEWVQLFNGKNLDGWTPKIKGHELGENFGNTFRVESGVLKVAYDQYKNFDGKFGHLFFKDTFSHYVLRVEYRFIGDQVPGGPTWAVRNSGIMIHGQSAESMEMDQDFPVSIEVQLLGGSGSGERPTANVCTPGTHIVMDGKLITRHCTNSTSKTYHGDQWVTVEVEVRGNQLIKHTIDGKAVLTYSEPQLDDGDRFGKKVLMGRASKLLDRGTISLQSESHPVEFRKVELRKLAE